MMELASAHTLSCIKLRRHQSFRHMTRHQCLYSKTLRPSLQFSLVFPLSLRKYENGHVGLMTSLHRCRLLPCSWVWQRPLKILKALRDLLFLVFLGISRMICSGFLAIWGWVTNTRDGATWRDFSVHFCDGGRWFDPQPPNPRPRFDFAERSESKQTWQTRFNKLSK